MIRVRVRVRVYPKPIDAKIRTTDADVDAMLARLLGDAAVGLVHQLPWTEVRARARARVS